MKPHRAPKNTIREGSTELVVDAWSHDSVYIKSIHETCYEMFTHSSFIDKLTDIDGVKLPYHISQMPEEYRKRWIQQFTDYHK